MDDDSSTLPPEFEDAFTVEPSLLPRLAFRLLDLPPEIWLTIGTYAVTKRPLNVAWAETNKAQEKMLAQPAITRTCRLLRNELLPVFYKRNSFSAHHLACVGCFRMWFPAIGQANCEAMGTFTFLAQYSTEFWVDQFKRVGIEVRVSMAADQSMPGAGLGVNSLLVTFRDMASLRAEQIEYDTAMGEAMELFDAWITSG